ncbi:bacterioferritin-associated ferredoxin [Rhodoligotrophos appendicifer]
MFVCSCNVITAAEIKCAMAELLATDSMRVLTPGLIYRTLGHRPKCGSCLPHVSWMIEAAQEEGAYFTLDEICLAKSA